MKDIIIGNLVIKNGLMLAPMAGITNYAYRKLCKKHGASLVFTEMISDKGIFYNTKNTLELMKTYEDEHPIAVQLFGYEIETMKKAVEFINDNIPCEMININAGCPVPKVAIKSKAGSSLLKNPDLLYELVKTIVDSTDKIVSVKIRIGWDEKNINCVEVSKLIEDAGAKLIIVHGRTRSQGYSGSVNLDAIKSVKDNVSIPVVGNGDIVDAESAKHMLDYTGVDGLMIGRASIGNPFIFNDIVAYIDNGIVVKHTLDEVKKVFIEHLSGLVEQKGERVAVSEMRGIGAKYFKGIKGVRSIKSLFSSAKSPEEYMKIIEMIKE